MFIQKIYEKHVYIHFFQSYPVVQQWILKKPVSWYCKKLGNERSYTSKVLEIKFFRVSMSTHAL